MIIAGIADAETGGNIANLMFSLCLIFCGVIASPSQFPRFWIFMYRVSPFTYLVSGMLSVGLAGNTVTCAQNEYVQFSPADGQTCYEYLSDYRAGGGMGALEPGNESNRETCRLCSYTSTDVFLAGINSSYDDRWRNFGILWAFIIFNIFAAIGLYWLARVPKKQKKEKEN
jgi:ABC-type multidrug transport system permease subunit